MPALLLGRRHISHFREYYLKIVAEGQADFCSKSIQSALYPFSKIYGFAVKTRIFFYRKGVLKATRLPVPVISVGNITLGGTGKTPFIEYIARYLDEKGKKSAILSRGYAAAIWQKGGDTAPGACNDEYLVFQENIPYVRNLLNKDRVAAGREAIRDFQAECLLLDDGFQHLRLARDLDIVIIDALNPFGYDYLTPRGMLREPLEALKRADLIALTHVDQCSLGAVERIIDRLRKIAGHIPVVKTIHQPVCLETQLGSRLNVHGLEGKGVFAFCAIGNPMSLRKSIENLGAKVLGFRTFPDHHAYSLNDLKKLDEESQRLMPDAIITTQKDKVKIKNDDVAWGFPLWTLKMEIRILEGCGILERKIDAVFN
ncbi:MAG: tetraacyldisaccharide 4'-kinase [Planctomycetota bacterium]